MSKRVKGIGGIFFKAKNPKDLLAWYSKHLGISPLPHSPWGPDDDAALFEYRNLDNPDQKNYAVFSASPEDSDEFDKPFMFNFRVDDLDTVLAELAEEGIEKDGDIQEYTYGRFVHLRDPEGNRIELWEPAEGF